MANLSVAFGTDAGVNGYGFDFDQVTLTDFDLQVPDTQACGLGPDARRGSGASRIP